MGKASKVLGVTEAVWQVVCHSQSWAQDQGISPDTYSPWPSRGSFSILSNTHLGAICPLIGTELQSGTSVLEEVQSPSSKRWQTEPWGVWLSVRLQAISEDLGLRNSCSQARRLPGRARWVKGQLHPLLGSSQLSACSREEVPLLLPLKSVSKLTSKPASM